ncbi:Endonuclease/exonuclease/phosphatase [Mycena rosella]|uniref:Endonuclease/exonuclease/phosphatase n=1 Tax=Mycena rosella TaxID=1033263 RepID=A0AAD7CP78_MYCRO|nr:Endonuclease/exonuclease/phosphatase [Mycena rosella]
MRQQINNPEISRKTQAEIKLTTVNSNGCKKKSIKHPAHKWHEWHHIMFDKKIGVLGAVETHLSAAQALEIQDSHLGRHMEIYNSPNLDDPSTRGVAIVLNRELTSTKGVKIHYLIPRRAILAVIPWHGKRTLTALVVYAPAESMDENEAFWDEMTNLWMTIDLPVPNWVGGDTNNVEEPINQLPHRHHSSKPVYCFQNSCKHLLGLLDGWRRVNPNTKAYTYTSTHHSTTHLRINCIYVSPALMKNCSRWTIHNVGKVTDHRMVSVVVSAPGSPYIGCGLYSILLFLLEENFFIKFVIDQGVDKPAL